MNGQCDLTQGTALNCDETSSNETLILALVRCGQGVVETNDKFFEWDLQVTKVLRERLRTSPLTMQPDHADIARREFNVSPRLYTEV